MVVVEMEDRMEEAVEGVGVFVGDVVTAEEIEEEAFEEESCASLEAVVSLGI